MNLNLLRALVVRALLPVLLLGAPAARPVIAQTPLPATAFEFVAIGDVPYNIPADYEKFDRLLARINALKPAFTVHTGDIISGRTLCSDENFQQVKRRFDAFEGALVYTPGDNEWTDCHRKSQGRFDPLERLARVRALFFADPARSLGAKPLAVESQARVMADKFAPYVENARFVFNSVHFATVHVVGSNNNSDETRPAMQAEFAARDAANMVWIDQAFERAISAGAPALVLIWQANVHRLRAREPEGDYSPAFAQTINAVERGAKAFGKPVLVIYGDFHFLDYRPFNNMRKRRMAHVMALQVYGDRHVHGVRVRVDPSDAGVFSLQPLIVRENGLP